ncbi:MAG: ribokinase [Coprobacillus cateniformis]|uniref:PfkB family carbohydrate kinase n=1 Tax=Longibaculum muris TaxID=1796628 RepID=UPI003AB5DBF0|nr:ribokinase [Coprobacillus cateniformis]
MKKTLVIGSSVCDVIIRLHRIPQVSGDENIIHQELSIGGCAYNVAHILDNMHCPYDLFSPVGQGIYGDFVRKHFKEKKIPIMIESQQKNGCCYCLVDDSGERTFICEHGAEYFYQSSWFDQLDANNYQQVYVCGLEIEEDHNEVIIQFLASHPHLTIYFAPGPRINAIERKRLMKLLYLHPIVHLNQQEIFEFTKQNNLSIACASLYQITQAPIIVTLGKDGCYYYDEKTSFHTPSIKTTVVDTIGAGDSHIGTIMACRSQDMNWPDCLIKANQIASLVVSQKGSTL